MPNYTQKDKATKGNMAAQQKKKKYTSVENSDGTTTNTFEKKRKLGKNKGEVKKRVTSIVKKDKSGETRGIASVTQTYDKEGKLKKEKGSGRKKELASLKESVKKDNSIAAAQKKGAPAKPTSSISKASLILRPNKEVFKNIKSDTKIDVKLMKEPKSPELVIQMKGKAMTSDEMALAPSRQVMRNRENIDFDSSTDRGIKSLYTGKRQEEYHTSGMPKFITSAESGERINTTTGGIDEGSFTKITTNIPERSKVTATEDSDKYQKGEEFYVDPARMHPQHPSKQRMANMVNKVATYNMPNVKAAQKKYHK